MKRSHSLILSFLLLLPASAAPAATNLCLNKPTYATAYDSATYQPAYAVDGKGTTYWRQVVTPGEKWVVVDLGSARTIRRWVVKNACVVATEFSPYTDCVNYTIWGYALQVSNDNLYWNDVDWLDGNYRAITDRDINATTGRYFAIDIWQGYGAIVDDGARVVEFELYEQPLNLARGAVAKASSSAANQGPSLALDGYVSTFVDDSWDVAANDKWQSNNTGDKWLQVDLGAAKNVLKWVVHHAGAGGEDSRLNTKDFKLQGSADAKTWTTLDTVTGNLANTTNRNLPAAKSYRYFRLLITNAGGDGTARIYEFQLYGPEVLPTPPATYKEDATAFPYHSNNMKLVKYDSEVAIYFDQDPGSAVDSKYANDVFQTVRTLWNEVRRTWGTFGLNNRLFFRAHQITGGYVGTSDPYYRYSLFENFVDVKWSKTWALTEPDLPLLKRIFIHEMNHTIEQASNYSFSPAGAAQAANLWGDDAFANLVIWDVLKKVGTANEATLAYNAARDSDGTICVPDGGCPPGTDPTKTFWFRNFFEPIYNAGGIGVFVRYFQLVRQFYGVNDQWYYAQRMNVGEFIHFMSAAAGVSERAQAWTAFQGKDATATAVLHGVYAVAYEQARVDYPQLNSLYTYVP